VNMFRGPQGIGAYQQYAEGGAVISEDALTQMRQKVINDYGFDPIDVAMEEGVDPELFLRVMYTENRGQQGPVSEKGAIGLMQLMPDTAAELGVDPNNPLDNARGGARYLRQQLATFQSIPLALAAYNAGPGAVRKYNGVPPYEETRNYVAMIHGVDAGEILPSMNDFYIRVPGEDPSRRPRMRPEGLGTPGYVPAEPAQSEYLMGIGQTFMNTIQPERTPAPYIPNIMQPQEPPQEDARGIEFYRQYAAFQPPTAAG
ncbi:MAG: lytic transglycosylase domain-containing protein, partial [Alphaproteobacteria bacterium]